MPVSRMPVAVSSKRSLRRWEWTASPCCTIKGASVEPGLQSSPALIRETDAGVVRHRVSGAGWPPSPCSSRARAEKLTVRLRKARLLVIDP